MTSWKHPPYKDSFYIQLPTKKEISFASHLPDHLAHMCANAVQKPINPHRQKHLAASKRPAKVELAKGPEQSSGKPKAKAKAKCKAKAKAAPKVPKVAAAPKKEDTDQYKDSYNTAKKAFMDEPLD